MTETVHHSVSYGSLWRISEKFLYPLRMPRAGVEQFMVNLYGIFTVVKLERVGRMTRITLACSKESGLRTELGYGAFIRDAVFTKLT